MDIMEKYIYTTLKYSYDEIIKFTTMIYSKFH